MISATRVRRASWLGAFAMIVLTASSLRADENPRQPAQPPQEVVPFKTYSSTKYRLDMIMSGVPKVLAEQLDLKGGGAVVVRVEPEGPAAKAGIKAHDIVLAVGDTPIKGPSDLMDAVDKSEGKELSLKLMRAGKPITVAITPEKRTEGAIGLPPGGGGLGFELPREIRDEIRDLQNKIRERLKEAGGDMRMEFFQPGRMPPPGMRLGIQRHLEFPDDLSVTIHKQGKNPAEIEVKQGDQTWKVRENELAQLPEEARKHVEDLLGHGPRQWGISGLRFDGPPHDGPGAPPGPPGGPDHRPGRPRPHGPPLVPEDGDGPHAGRPSGPDGSDGPIELQERRDDQRGYRSKGALERRLSEMGREMHRVHEQIEELRRGLREELKRDGGDDDDSPKP